MEARGRKSYGSNRYCTASSRQESIEAFPFGCYIACMSNQRVTPQLRMTKWDRTRPFYVDGLGFGVEWEHTFAPGFPVFAEVSRDGLALFLTEHTGDCEPGGACYIVVDDVDALYREIIGRGVKPAEAPEDAPWGTREMLVIDPDGNRLRFANPKSD
jgi:uncharacterized glyoxalase superfamily protein PhnB